MAGKDHSRGTQHLYRMCTALPALTFTCVTLWFFCFLFNYCSSPVQRLISEEGDTKLGKASHVESDQQKNSNEEEQGSALNTAYANARHSNRQIWPSELEEQNPGGFSYNGTCDLAWGRWVRDEHSRQNYDESCRDIFRGWNCLRNNKSNAKDILAWRWQPWQCDLPRMNATLFLERFRNKRIGFIGDSLNRNMYVSFVCSLKKASPQVKKWRPAGADKALTFLDYNLTVAYHRTNLLARYGQS